MAAVIHDHIYHEAAPAVSSSSSGGFISPITSDIDDEPRNSRPAYADLIIRAISSHPKKALTLKGIYDWLEKNTALPDVKLGNPHGGWKNSVRHTLSLSKCFKRITLDSEPLPTKYWTVDTKEIGAGVRSFMVANCHSEDNQWMAKPAKPFSTGAGHQKEISASRCGETVWKAAVDLPSAQFSSKGRSRSSRPVTTNASDSPSRLALTTPAVFMGGDIHGHFALGAAAIEILTGLDASVFNCLCVDLEKEANNDSLHLVTGSESWITVKEALLLTLTEVRHGDNIPGDFHRLWFSDTKSRHGDVKKQWERLRERWIPFLACWLDDLIVWPNGGDSIHNSENETLEQLRNLLGSQEHLSSNRVKRFVGVFDLLTYHVKLSPYSSDCCRWTAVILLVYDVSGAITYRSPAYWTACKKKNQSRYEAAVQRAVTLSWGSTLESLLEPGHSLLAFSDDLRFAISGRLSEAVYFVKSRSVRRLLKAKLADRLKSNAGLLSREAAPCKTPTDILLINEIVTIGCALCNLMPPISWEERDEDETD